MGRKKLTWKHIMSSCRQVESPHLPEPKNQVCSQQGSFRRISISDVSDSPIPIDELSKSMGGSKLYVFTYAELRVMTHKFSWNNLLGEGGFGPVYKGFADNKLRPGLEAQPVAVKSLNLDGSQGHREWLAEIVILGQLVHPHIVKLIGYCCQDEHRLLIYEYMPRGSLENQLFRRYSAALPWSTRMKIALGAARGLAFLHEGDNPVIYRDFKASNILLDSDYTAKLSDFGLAKDGLEGDDTNVAVCIMGTKGYVAPEYVTTGHLTTKSDVYSFGVVLLELITGKRSWDKIRPNREQSLVAWARPLLKDLGRLGRVIDPRLEGQFSTKGAQKAASLACKCLSNNPKNRPRMAHVVKVLESLQDFDDGLVVPFVYTVPSTRNEGEDKDGVVSGDCAEGRNGCYNLVHLGHNGWRHKVKLPLSLLAYSPSYIHKNFGDDIYI